MFKRCYLLFLLLFLSLVLILAIRSEDPAGPVYTEMKTAHYDLNCEQPYAQEYGELVEQVYSQLEEFFGAKPAWRGRLSVFADEADYATALKDAGTFEASKQASQTGGMYLNRIDVAMVKRSPSAWVTQGAIIHEAVHQFHFQSRTKDQAMPSSAYYSEGLAKYFEQRHWDGQSLQKDVIKESLVVDIFRIALDRFRMRRSSRLRNIVTDSGEIEVVHIGVQDYDEAYLFVRFLIECHPKEFRELAQRLDEGSDPGIAWDDVFGASSAEVDMEYAEWLQAHVRKSSYVSWSGYWQQAGDWIEGSVLDEPVDKSRRFVGKLELKAYGNPISLEIRGMQGAAEAGVFLYEADETIHFVSVTADGRIKSRHATAEADWTSTTIATLQGHPRLFRLTMQRGSGEWSIRIDERNIVSIPTASEAKIGLAVIGRAEFRIAPSKNQ